MKPSPCIGYCQIEEACGLCAGCARTRNEIAEWKQASPARVDAIWALLPERRAKLGIGLHRLGWTQGEIREFVAGSLRSRSGAWVIGVYGAVAEFWIGAGEAVEFDFGEHHLAAATPRGAVRFEITDRTRALALTTTVGCAKKELIVLAVPRANPAPRRAIGLIALGADRAAIRASARDELLFDLGIGIGEMGFCVRTSDPELARGLNSRLNQKWPELLAGLGRQILQASPTRVARSPVGRLEVFTPIPAPGGQSPDGPHTHLLPAHLALERETPPGFEVPEAYAPCAIFYPTAGPPDSCA